MADRAQENVATDTATASAGTVGTSAASLVAARPSRVSILIYNNAANTIYVGATSGVTTSTGLPIIAGGSLEEREYTGAIYAISGSAAQNVRLWEVG